MQNRGTILLTRLRRLAIIDRAIKRTGGMAAESAILLALHRAGLRATPRTIERDVALLCNLGAPIAYDVSHSTYRLFGRWSLSGTIRQALEGN
jgi:predicted DNA-binding transcriptional regulator YafY